MTMQTDFRAALAAANVVTAARIGWGTVPQGATLPALVLNVIDHADGETLKGRDGLFAGLVQVDCYALTPKAVQETADAVVSALSGYRAGNFRRISLVGRRDSREGGSNEAERPYRVSLDFETHWRV